MRGWCGRRQVLNGPNGIGAVKLNLSSGMAFPIARDAVVVPVAADVYVLPASHCARKLRHPCVRERV